MAAIRQASGVADDFDPNRLAPVITLLQAPNKSPAKVNANPVESTKASKGDTCAEHLSERERYPNTIAYSCTAQSGLDTNTHTHHDLPTPSLAPNDATVNPGAPRLF